MPGIREDWFPTSIWYFDAEPGDGTAAALAALLAGGAAPPAGELAGRAEIASFTALVLRNALEVARFERWDLERAEPRLARAVAVASGSAHAPDPGAALPLCGVYVVSAPEKGGSLHFDDPRSLPTVSVPPVVEYTPWTFRRITYAPVPGRMLLFPGWLRAGVEPAAAGAPGVSIHFSVTVAAREPA